jgi:hypothetical protein
MAYKVSHLVDPTNLSHDQIEAIEKVSTRFIYQAIRDFVGEAVDIFANSPDDQTEVAEDITREALGRLPGFPLPERIFGVMDFKRAGYVFLPQLAARQALLVDSKAEKARNVARLQTSQTSLPIRLVSHGREVNVAGQLGVEMLLHDNPFLVTTIFVHYHYEEQRTGRLLKNITIAALPNGILAEKYVPNAHDTIFKAGPHAPTRGEAFRTRLSFARLRKKCRWRVQYLSLGAVPPGGQALDADTWEE